MPLYEFSCRKCGERFEEIMSFAELEAEAPRCPACGSGRVEKGFSTFSTRTGGDSAGAGCEMADRCGAAGSGFS